MPLSSSQALSQIKDFLCGLTLRQKLTLALAAVVVAGTLWAFVYLLGRANYKPLYSALSPQEGQAIARRLAAKNIPYELSNDATTIRVPASQLNKARLEMASQGLPQTGRLGFELFDKPNWAGSDFAEKVNYQRALEGELERTIQTIGEVEAVRVHLVMPRESLFTEREREAKASVVLKLRGARLDDEGLTAIRHLVASAVDKLQPENVTVVNAEGQTPLLARGRDRLPRPPHWAEVELTLADKITTTLNPVVGPGKVRASVTVEWEMGSSDSTQETYDPSASALLSSQVSEEKVTDTAAEGVPGTPSNVPGAQSAATSGTPAQPSLETQGTRTESKTFAVSKTVRHMIQPPGTIKRITAAVLVDDATEVKEESSRKVETRRKRTPEEMKQIQELAMAAMGFDAARGDHLAVENLSFQTLPFPELAQPSWVGRLAPMLERWIGLLRYAVLALLFLLTYLLVLRPVKQQAVTAFRELPRQLAAARRAATAELTPGSPEVGELKLEEGAAVGGLVPPEAMGPAPELKQAVMLKQHLVDKVRKEPEAASRLIQNWIRQEAKL